MKYTIKQVEKILENGVATKQLLTLSVERDSGVVSEHGKHIPVDADPKAEAEIFAAELSLVLKEEPVITTEEVVVATKDKEIKEEKIQERLDIMEEEKASKEEVIEEPILEEAKEI